MSLERMINITSQARPEGCEAAVFAKIRTNSFFMPGAIQDTTSSGKIRVLCGSEKCLIPFKREADFEIVDASAPQNSRAGVDVVAKTYLRANCPFLNSQSQTAI